MEPNRTSLAARLWAQAEPKAFQSLYHPFVATLASGALAKEDFQAFLLQDAFFLNAFAQAFAFAVTKTTTPQHTLAIIRRMGGIEHELRTHTAFLESFGIDVFQVTEATVAPATRAYVDFLLTTAKRSDSVAEILAAMTPCMRLYAFLGQQIAAAACTVEKYQPNPYQKWIDSYSPDAFNAAADDAEQHLDELAEFEHVSYETLLALYNRAMELELGFFEQYFPMARASATYPPSTLAFPMTIYLEIPTTDETSMMKAPANKEFVTTTGSIATIATLSPGQYEVTVFENPFGFEIVPTTKESRIRVPLFATVLGASTQFAVAQSEAELMTFLQLLCTRGSFATYSQPTTVHTRRVPRVLTIAGSDNGGGAGIQADLKACTNLSVFSASAIVAVTVQNTLGVHGFHVVPLNTINDQITAVLDDIGADVVKTGMLATEEVIELVASVLEPRNLPLVVDPVMVATSGDRLFKDTVHETMVKKLFPLATIITPNIPEASVLLNDRVIESIEDMKQAARDLAAFGPSFVLVKGGHLKNPPDGQVHDMLFDVQRNEFFIFQNPMLTTRNTHGTGCTLASAIAAQFAKSGDMVHAVRTAIAYLHNVLYESQSLTIGKGVNGPMLHVV